MSDRGIVVVQPGTLGGPDSHLTNWTIAVTLEIWGEPGTRPKIVVPVDLRRVALLQLLGEQHRDLIDSKEPGAEAVICDLIDLIRGRPQPQDHP